MRQCSSSYRMSGVDRRTNVDVQILSAASKALAEKCFWNACKALSFGLFLMAIGAIMAIIGYYAEQLSSDDILTKIDGGNSSSTATKSAKKSSHTLYKLSYAGPIVMGVGGFIVVAACVMTFEARDRAAKFMSNQLKIMGGTGTMAGHRHSRQTTSVGYPSRGDSGRSSYQNHCDGSRQKINKSPSAPNLAAGTRLPGRLPLRHKLPLHIMSPGSRTLFSPRALRRQAMSMDNQDYSPFFSPPRTRHSSSGLLTKGSRESMNDPRTRGSQGSMALDLHVPNECSVTMRVRDRSRRSDTARRHVLRRQTPVELDDAVIAYAVERQRAKWCTRSATCDVPHIGRSKKKRQDSSCSDIVARRRSGSPICGWRSSNEMMTGSSEWPPRNVIDSAVMLPQQTDPPTVHKVVSTSHKTDSKLSLSRTCSDIVSIDKSFEEVNYSSS
ncbi:uncharacterized protein LOC126899073 isoform X2 [Daktulosphaira vitifoliae]|uniref:uncharacterized protein LOC126899073 isoform X2 n=1 Tax=Daktulosphaira vitifoliae TaxID=58002 RepID=UPI0021AAB908|nr:uncharacterized protein LOC126899073 isoform X2 [Daktulosphaira vitifoliae]XP_050529592.1 uncharacterized protein LOC126899073 isoform X2 [Daktulosphaira vitifoliae]